MKNNILLRADDLGYSEGINYGIEKSVKDGIIKSVGIMMNMPATIHGINLIKNEDIAFGLHTNICAGIPISNPLLIPSLVDEKGYFKNSKFFRESLNDFIIYEEVLIEIEAQYNRFLEIFHKKPDYFEGHAVKSNNFFNAMKDFSEKYELKYFGLPENISPNKKKSASSFIYVNNIKIYFVMESMDLDYNPEKTFLEMLDNLHDDGIDMMIFHPGYLDDYILNNSSLTIPRTKEVEMLISSKIKKIINDRNINVLSHKDL